MSSHDFIRSLADPLGWLTGVINNFIVHGFDQETCTIRRGITGTGIAPNYKIEEPSRLVTIYVGTVAWHDTAILGITFNGRHHWEMTWLDDRARQDEHWSAPMTFHDIKKQLSQISKEGIY